MESAQKELIGVLLDHICSLGLISRSVYSKAMDQVFALTDLPGFFEEPMCRMEEVAGDGRDERAQDTQ